jgi:site-specific DNA-methyltransferase (adenine-specific)
MDNGSAQECAATVLCGDCLDLIPQIRENVDLVFCSPPYENVRKYGELDFALSGNDWVQWAVDRFIACYERCNGLVAWVVEGKTKNYQYSATPVLLMAELHKRKVKLRKPPVFHRIGIPGSGGPDWLRNDFEFIVCASHGKLPWSDNTACGSAPKWKQGGRMSNRTASGHRVNSGVIGGRMSKLGAAGQPAIANPGNVIRCVVGGGRMGSLLAHENEAPFPEALAEFFIKSFCPPGGTVLDPFCGSGTTLAVARRLDRNSIGIDVRPSQVDLTKRRLNHVYVS